MFLCQLTLVFGSLLFSLDACVTFTDPHGGACREHVFSAASLENALICSFASPLATISTLQCWRTSYPRIIVAMRNFHDLHSFIQDNQETIGKLFDLFKADFQQPRTFVIDLQDLLSSDHRRLILDKQWFHRLVHKHSKVFSELVLTLTAENWTEISIEINEDLFDAEDKCKPIILNLRDLAGAFGTVSVLSNSFHQQVRNNERCSKIITIVDRSMSRFIASI